MLVLLLITAMQLKQTARFSNLFILAERLELGQRVDPSVIARYGYLIEEIVEEGRCRSDLLMSGATVTLATLDDHEASRSSPEWTGAAVNAERFLAHSTTCAPLNGNFWLRRAMVSEALGRSSDLVAQHMTRAQATAPAEQDIVIARLYAWNRMNASILDLAAYAALQDLHIGVLNADARLLASALLPLSESLKALMPEVAIGLSLERKHELKRAGIDID